MSASQLEGPSVRRLSGREALSRAASATSVAIIGASANPLKLGHMVLKTLLNAGYEGACYPINPSADAILGITAYSKLTHYRT